MSLLLAIALSLASNSRADAPPPLVQPVRTERADNSLFDMKAGGTPSAGSSIFQGELGISALPSLAYHYAVLDALTVGARFTFDYAYYTPSAPFTPSLLLQVPVRISAYRAGRLTLGVHFDPGFGFTFYNAPTVPGFGGGTITYFNLLLGVGLEVGYHVIPNKFVVGGGFDMPVAIVIPTGPGANTALRFPLLFGPLVEFHPLPELPITFDMKFGPIIANNGSAIFAMKLLAGVAYKLD